MEKGNRNRESLRQEEQLLRQRKNILYSRVGRAIYDLPLGEDSPDKLLSIAESISSIEKEISDSTVNQEKVMVLMSEQNSLKGIQKERLQRLKRFDEDCSKLLENLGRVGYQAFREGLIRADGLDELFGSLRQMKEKDTSYEVVLKGESWIGARLLDRVINKGKGQSKRSRSLGGARAISKEYERVGRGMLENTSLEYGGVESVATIANKYLEHNEAREKLASEHREGTKRESDLIQELRECEAARAPSLRLRQLKRTVSELEAQKDTLLIELGAKVVDHSEVMEQLAKELQDQIGVLLQEQVTLKLDIEAFERKCHASELNHRLKKKNAELKALERGIEKRKREVTRINEEIVQLEQELSSVSEKERVPTDD